jgi:hypothetical protein
MKRILAALVVTLMLAGSAAASDRMLDFVWSYTNQAASMIDGFRLYQDGVRMDITIPPTARKVSTPQIVDFSSHDYHLTAFKGVNESLPSDTQTAPSYFAEGLPGVDVGTFIMTIRRIN